MDPFSLLVYNLKQLGFYGFLLPWIFVFAVVYALLLKSKLIEEQRIIGVISLVIAFFITGYGAVPLGTFLTNIFGLATLVLALILVVIIFGTMAGFDFSKLAENKIALGIAIGLGLIVFLSALSIRIYIDQNVVAIIFVLIIMIAAIYFLSSASK